MAPYLGMPRHYCVLASLYYCPAATLQGLAANYAGKPPAEFLGKFASEAETQSYMNDMFATKPARDAQVLQILSATGARQGPNALAYKTI